MTTDIQYQADEHCTAERFSPRASAVFIATAGLALWVPVVWVVLILGGAS